MLIRMKNILNRNRKCCSRTFGDINMEQLKKMQNIGAVLIDVRSPQEFEEGHLNAAISLPEYEIKSKAKQILVNKKQLIVVYCSTGHRSERAKYLLKRIGYENVYNLNNGFQNY